MIIHKFPTRSFVPYYQILFVPPYRPARIYPSVLIICIMYIWLPSFLSIINRHPHTRNVLTSGLHRKRYNCLQKATYYLGKGILNIFRRKMSKQEFIKIALKGMFALNFKQEYIRFFTVLNNKT